MTYAHDNGRYIGLYRDRAGKLLCGAVWKDNERCMKEWEDMDKTNIIWI